MSSSDDQLPVAKPPKKGLWTKPVVLGLSIGGILFFVVAGVSLIAFIFARLKGPDSGDDPAAAIVAKLKQAKQDRNQIAFKQQCDELEKLYKPLVGQRATRIVEVKSVDHARIRFFGTPLSQSGGWPVVIVVTGYKDLFPKNLYMPFSEDVSATPIDDSNRTIAAQLKRGQWVKVEGEVREVKVINDDDRTECHIVIARPTITP